VEYTIHVPHSEHIEHIGTVTEPCVSPAWKPSRTCTPSTATLKCWKLAEACMPIPPDGNVHLELAHLLEKNAAKRRDHEWLCGTRVAVKRSGRS